MIDSSDDAITKCDDLLKYNSPTLKIKKLAIGGYGIFAKIDIARGDCLLSRKCPINISTKQLGVPVASRHCFNCCQPIAALGAAMAVDCCKDVFYCNALCQIQARDNYHQVLHGRDYSQLYKDAGGAKGLDYSAEFTKLVFLRILAICVQAGVHPLKNFLFAGLLSATGADYEPAITWTFDGRVKGPIKMLEEFGINVFTNMDYEAWVLEQLW